MMTNLATFLIIIASVGIRLILASPVVARNDHALDDWLNQSIDVEISTNNPNKNPGEDCTVATLGGKVIIRGKALYPRDCSALSVYRNSFEKDENARLADPDRCIIPFLSPC